MSETWCRGGAGRVTLTLHIQPGAKKTEVAGPPVDGKANAALIEFVADRLGLPKSAVTLKSGQTSRRKVLEVVGMADDVLRILRVTG